jgi:neurotransmitter:Na+ symporter, NSS family
MAMTAGRDSWTGRVGFILATIGSAVGIGSIWKFPYEVGSNGGAGFVLFYLVGLALIVVPLMLAEFAIGRRGRADAMRSIATVARASGASPGWAGLGLLGAATGFLVLSFYSVIGGWTIGYAIDTLRFGLPGGDPGASQARFDALLAKPAGMAVYHALFMAMTGAIVARGVAHGIEAACKVLMPILIVLIVGLAAYSVIEGDVSATLRFLFGLRLDTLTSRAALEALGLGFFSIGVGFALMTTYAAYAGRNIDLREVALVTVVGDTAISLLSGFAVFPIVFANGLDPANGPGLIFVTLPLAFSRMPAGVPAAAAFYLLLLTAALASAISMLELVVAPLARKGLSRISATAISSLTIWALGLVTVLSFNVWSDWRPLAAMPRLGQANWFEAIDHLTSNLLLPVGGLGLAVFAGWIAPGGLLRKELGLGPSTLAVLRGLLRYVVPLAILAVALAPYLT